MKSFKHYLFEASQDLDRDIKKKMAEEAVKALEQDDFWNSKTSAEKEQAIKDARKKAEEDYDKLSEEDKKKKRKEYKKSSKQTQNEKTDKEVDGEIKKKLADDAEAEIKKTEGFEDENPEYQKQAIEDARKKAEEKYDELSDEDKKKKREEYRKPQNTSTKIDNTNKKQESKKTEDKLKELKSLLKKKDEDLTPKELRKLEKYKEDKEIDWDDLSPEESKKLKSFNNKEDNKDKKLKELKSLLAKNKEDLTQNEQKRIEQLKNDPDVDKNDLTKQEIKSLGSKSVTDEFLNKLKDVDKSLSERDGVYKQLKSMTPEILTVFALCCPVGALAIGGAITLGLLSSIVIKKCIENKDSKTANAVVDSAIKVADGDEDTLNDLKNIKKSAFMDDNELATDEDFELNLKENGLDKIVKTLKDNKEALDTEVDTEQIQQAMEQVSNNSAEETGEETGKETGKSKRDVVNDEQSKEVEKIQQKHLEEFDRLQKDFTDKMRSAKSREEIEELKKEFGDKTKELQEKTKADIDDISNLGDEYSEEMNTILDDCHKKSSKELDDFLEKTKDMNTESEEYKKLKKEFDEKIKGFEKERDTKLDDATEKAWERKKSNSNKNEKDLSNEDIEKMQDEMANLDPEKDKDKIKEMEGKLKDAAKKAGKDESEYLMKTDTNKDGKQRQRKTGPRGGKYYRVKGDDGWGDWISGEPNECLSSSIKNNINESCNKNSLKKYLYSKL